MDKISLNKIIDKIAQDLLNQSRIIINDKNGIYRGEIGVAIFFALYYLRGDKKDQVYLDQIYTIIEQSLNQISLQESNALVGVAGIGWGIQYLVNINIITLSEVTPYVNELSSFIKKSLTEDKQANNYDLLDGYIGKALFLIQSSKLQDNHGLQSILEDSITFFDSFAVKDKKGVAWSCSDFTQKNTFYLGLSHGVASIIYFLSNIYLLISDEKRKVRVRFLIEEACTWLLEKERNKDNSELSFPSIYPRSGLNKKNSTRLAWCHGDLGISLSLIKAGKVLGNNFFLNQGIRIATKGSKLLLHTSGIRCKQDKFDCSLCHGVFGAFLIYHKLYEEFKIPEFRNSLNYWLSIITKQSSNLLNAPYCGIANINKENDTLIESQETGLLFGVTGSTLALLTYLADISDNTLSQ